jgi:hypothetical protein
VLAFDDQALPWVIIAASAVTQRRRERWLRSVARELESPGALPTAEKETFKASRRQRAFGEPLAAFVRRKGGINKCAARFTRCLGRRDRTRSAEQFLALIADAAAQCSFARMIASERAPTRMRLTAQVTSRLNQLRDTNLSPR